MREIKLDSGVSWKSAADVINEICEDTADVSYDSRKVGDFRLPTVEIRLDSPEKLLYGTSRLDAIEVDTDVWNDKKIILSGGYADVIYRAFKEMVRIINHIGTIPEFAWSSIPLAPLSDDKKLQVQREQAMYGLGAVHTLWVRDTDENIQSQLKKFTDGTLIQVQNMASANTWITGSVKNRELENVI